MNAAAMSSTTKTLPHDGWKRSQKLQIINLIVICKTQKYIREKDYPSLAEDSKARQVNNLYVKVGRAREIKKRSSSIREAIKKQVRFFVFREEATKYSHYSIFVLSKVSIQMVRTFSPPPPPLDLWHFFTCIKVASPHSDITIEKHYYKWATIPDTKISK